MNFLAHFYLSRESDELSLGNYLGDFVTAKEKKALPKKVLKGIELHYEIDRFTDSHEFFRESVKRLRPDFKKYAPVITDIYYDHFLASNWTKFHEESLDSFSEKKYQLLAKNQGLLTSRAIRFHQYMVSRNILVNYQDLSALQKVFEGMAYRAKFKSGMEAATDFLRDNYHDLNADFNAFFPQIKEHIEQEFKHYEE